MSSSESHEHPICENYRTCVGCRKKSYRSCLIGFYGHEGSVVFFSYNFSIISPAQITRDINQKSIEKRHGRGGWIHPAVECFNKAQQSGAIIRALNKNKKSLENVSEHSTNIIWQSKVDIENNFLNLLGYKFE